jgi:hypothetical protein
MRGLLLLPLLALLPPYFLNLLPLARCQPPPPPSINSPAPPKFFPTLSDLDVPVTNVNAPSTFTLVLGHIRPGYDLSRIRFQIVSSDKKLLRDHEITLKFIQGSSSCIVSAFPTCCPGTVQLM